MENLMTALRAAAEPTRLRLLALCGHAELTVTDLTQILGQSQPRVSRHLKLLCDAGLLNRYREGTSAHYRLAESGPAADLSRRLIDLIPAEDMVVTRDLERLTAVKRDRAEAAASYFRTNAERWNEIRSLYVDEAEVERALLDLFPEPIDDFLDIGTGTGRILEIFGPMVRHGTGIDASREMLALARARLDRAGLRHCQVRMGDMYNLPLPNVSMDVIIVHQVLHFADEPAEAIADAARVLRPGGKLVIVDFAPHALEFLRENHAHRRLGFQEDEIAGWCRQAGLDISPIRQLPGDPLTVNIWLASAPGPAV